MKVHTIEDVAIEARALLLDVLAECDTKDTTGSCLYASRLLALVAQSKGMNVDIKGGDGESDGGLFTMTRGHGHYWCVISKDEEVFIVDISADQFGYAGIIIKKITDCISWPRYIPGSQKTVDAEVETLIKYGY